jgi:hypothetical protein
MPDADLNTTVTRQRAPSSGIRSNAPLAPRAPILTHGEWGPLGLRSGHIFVWGMIPRDRSSGTLDRLG